MAMSRYFDRCMRALLHMLGALWVHTCPWLGIGLTYWDPSPWNPLEASFLSITLIGHFVFPTILTVNMYISLSARFLIYRLWGYLITCYFKYGSSCGPKWCLICSDWAYVPVGTRYRKVSWLLKRWHLGSFMIDEAVIVITTARWWWV